MRALSSWLANGSPLAVSFWGRREIPHLTPHHQDKATGNSFPIDQNSRTRRAGQLREKAGPCPDHVFLILKVRRPLGLHMCRKVPWWSKRNIVKGCMHTHGRIPRYTKYGLQTRQIIMIGQRKPEKNAPYEWFKLPCGHSSGSLPLSLPKCLSICTVLFFLINTSLASLLSVFVEILFCKVQGPGPLSLTTGLVARIWCSHYHDPAQSLVGNQTPR